MVHERLHADGALFAFDRFDERDIRVDHVGQARLFHPIREADVDVAKLARISSREVARNFCASPVDQLAHPRLVVGVLHHALRVAREVGEPQRPVDLDEDHPPVAVDSV